MGIRARSARRRLESDDDIKELEESAGESTPRLLLLLHVVLVI